MHIHQSLETQPLPPSRHIFIAHPAYPKDPASKTRHREQQRLVGSAGLVGDPEAGEAAEVG
ncbi:hypothetical protein GCM10009744_32830 [Kribbella alba]|uniref:Uncharacterized protein n=1 Tax=Kribbella alba TaxID=190197 RepID=A0ABN2FD03_9ACTN